MLTVSRNGRFFTYMYDRNNERIADDPDLIVDNTPSPPVSSASSVVADWWNVITSATMPPAGERYLNLSGQPATDADLVCGRYRCGGHHGQGRWLSHEPVGFAAGDVTSYSYDLEAPPSAEVDKRP